MGEKSKMVNSILSSYLLVMNLIASSDFVMGASLTGGEQLEQKFRSYKKEEAVKQEANKKYDEKQSIALRQSEKIISDVVLSSDKEG